MRPSIAIALALFFVVGCGGARSTNVPAAPGAADASSASSATRATAPLSSTQIAATAATGGAPNHVTTMLSYPDNGCGNCGLPASYIAAHSEYIEGAYAAENLAVAYKGAGGQHTMLYTDPTYHYPCALPRTCWGDDMAWLPESGWLHDSSGQRIWRKNHPSSLTQFGINVASSAAQAAYHNFTQREKSQYGFDLVLADDSAGANPTGYFYLDGTWSAYPVEWPRYNPTAYNSAYAQMFAASALPVVFNGITGNTVPTSMQNLGAGNVYGAMTEGCTLNDGAEIISDAKWVRQGNNTLAAINQYHAHVFCLSSWVHPTPAMRIYSYGTFLLTYDPTLSVWSPEYPSIGTPSPAGTNSCRSGSCAAEVVPEGDVVPRNAVQTASGNDVTTLRGSTGAYRREFASCYKRGASIGRCAVVVNPSSTSAVAMPALTAAYSHSTRLDDQNEYYGGDAHFDAPVPSSLGPSSAVLLVQ